LLFKDIFLAIVLFLFRFFMFLVANL